MGITNNIPPSRLIQPGVIDNAAARPASPFEGQCIFQKDTDQLLVWNGTAWVIPNSPAQNPMGLELVKSQTVGTAISSVTVSSAFSSIYDDYRIIYSGGTASASTDMQLKLGASVTGYYGSLQFQAVTSGTVSAAGSNNGATFPWVGGATTGQAVHASFDLFSPFLSLYTKIRNATYQSGDNYGIMNGEHRVATSYTDFTLIVASGTMTGGTISVYGYRK